MDRSGLSPFNSLGRAQRPPGTILINDCTLREGVQGLGIPLTPEVAAELATRLDQAGVPQFQVAVFGQPPDTLTKTIGALRRAGVRARLEGLVSMYDDWKDEIDRAVACEIDIINLMHATSRRRLQSLGLTEEQMLARSAEAVRYAVKTGRTVTFTPADTTRTEPEVLVRVTAAVAKAGAHRIVVTDTAGCADPHGITAIVTLVRGVAPMEIQVHCHNDLGLALANVFAAVEHGATVVDTTVLGLGERAGNPTLDEVAVGLELLYGVQTGINLRQMLSLAEDVASRLGVTIPLMKPLVGPHAFHWEYLDIPEPIPPEVVGNRRSAGSHGG